jgi:hypothetical protein
MQMVSTFRKWLHGFGKEFLLQMARGYLLNTEQVGSPELLAEYHTG